MENNIINNKFHWVYLIGFFLIASLPILAIPPLFHPPAWGKTIVFRIILSILIFFFIYQIIYRKNTLILEKLKSKSIKLVLGFLTLLFSPFLLSTIFSQDINFSFWGSPYRAGGFLNFAFYIIFAVLIFLILKPRNWKLTWNISLGIALLVSILALFQQFRFFKDFLVSYGARMPATLGSPIFLALYLSFFIFLSLSFAISEKNRTKKILYFLSFLIIAFVIFLTGTRAVFLGAIIGFLYFVLFYSNSKKLVFLKIATLILLILGVFGVYYLNVHMDAISADPLVAKNPTIATLLYRFDIKPLLEDPRFSFWKIAINSLKEKPLLGYGPENFSIAFDKYYDPSIPYLDYMTVSQVDRAHGFIFETAVTAGIPTLITFLSLFGVLFWQLQKVKHNQRESVIVSENSNPIIIHGIQATIIVYFIGVFFSFDTFDTYLMFFLLVGYCLYLISSNNKIRENQLSSTKISEKTPLKQIIKYKKVLIILLFVLLLLFLWQYNLKPLFINKDLNWANFYSTNGKCQKAIDIMEKVLPSHSIIDNYVLLVYSNTLKECQKTNPEQTGELIQKSIQILEKASKLRPTYTRTWILLGSYLNLSVENNQSIEAEKKNELLSKADSYFIKALQLNPKNQTILLERSNTYLLWKKYDEAKKIIEECIKLNPNFGSCWVQMAVTDIVIGNLTQANENLETASKTGFDVTSGTSLSRLLTAYTLFVKDSKKINLQYYQSIADIYQELIVLKPDNFQYHASLAFTYRTLGEYKKAREEALKVIELSPESKISVDEFLRTLPY